MVWTDSMISDYSGWLKAKPTPLRDQKTGWTAMPTPFVGLYNDLLEIFVKEDDGYIRLSDDGLTIWNAESAGLDIKRPEQKEQLNVILAKYRVELNDEGALDVKVEKDHFEQGKYSMLMTMFAINDMTTQGCSIFQKNVRMLMMGKKVNAYPQMQIKGRSGIDFTFDYIVSRPDVEYIIQTVGNLDKNNLAAFIFGFDEVKDFRRLVSDKDVRGMLIVNDQDKTVHQEFLRALTIRQLDYVLWSRREESPAWAKLMKKSVIQK